ncbi:MULTISPECIES: flagellar motor protein MotB [unclassified Providencia]|uniref:flagellar motor protein MotB n=1 Tax=unclassified Providencia TaxID=2633465 RepID=UPI000E8BE065|nr:flagellar motor protein MotB [Providencia sp.]MBP6079720.1 flagellar motor protein MotB [Providencia sp.]HBO23954.1 motility protein MotB [Providencia sp.]
MAANNPQIIRVKKRASHHQGGHGGSWKIAYADFMTAMMAFFLVMWLISISSPQELTQIAEYFRTPLSTAINPGKKSGDATNPIPGGGKDPIYRDGDVLPEPNSLTDGDANYRFEKLKKSLEQAILNDPRLNELKPHLLIDMINDGLRIQIVDSENRPMFKVGSATVEPYMRDILRAIAPLLDDVPNRISISGHTDDLPYANGANYSNWELSSDRANASRRELIRGGMNENKVLRVVGMAASIHLDKEHGLAPINRRISIIVLNDEETKQILREYDGATPINDVLNKVIKREPVPATNEVVTVKVQQ